MGVAIHKETYMLPADTLYTVVGANTHSDIRPQLVYRDKDGLIYMGTQLAAHQLPQRSIKLCIQCLQSLLMLKLMHSLLHMLHKAETARHPSFTMRRLMQHAIEMTLTNSRKCG